MRIFISHKLEDAATANLIAKELQEIKVECYLDLLDNSITENGKALTDHIRANLNDCTDIIVVMSNITRFSQWVPFEVGMAAQKDMPTATFLKEDVSLPDFLQWHTQELLWYDHYRESYILHEPLLRFLHPQP